MDIKEVIKTRRSIRAYQNKPVDETTIKQLIDAAIQAPSAMNTQPWAFAVIENADTLKDLSDRTKEYLLSQVDSMPAMANYREMLESPEFNVFYGAPALILICAKPGASPMAPLDCALAAQNLMLAARDLGLGSCWIGFVGMYLAGAEAKQLFGIPEDYAVHAPVIVGYPEGEFSTMERNAAQMIFWKQ